ncbi:MAG: cytochrome b N-terminal domain-containing protein [Anaerolineales bacterium]|nr:cytochrome b N-terminal domain-containing protein [Anaerolineales bacterium]
MSAARPSFVHHLHPPTIPAREARYRYTFGLGGISVFLCVVLLITGALELFFYVPTSTGANASLQTITLLVPYGRLVRSLHFWSAQILVVTSLLHMTRVVFTGAYKRPRRFNWLLGMGLLVLVLLFDFTGYVLRWDMDIAWALLVGTNLLKSVPLLGQNLYGLVVGGTEISSGTVVRFNSWHIYALPLVAVLLLAWHIFKVRRDGGISHSTKDSRSQARISRNELVNREVTAIFVTSVLLLGMAALFPPEIGANMDLQRLSSEASAPWFFLWIQQLLRLGPPFAMGVLIPATLLGILALIPYLIDRSREGSGDWFNRRGRGAQVILLGVGGLVLVLTLIGVLQ